MEFNDSRVDDVDGSVITPAAYILFFRRVSTEPRTLESLRALDLRCHDDSEWMKELLSEQAQCRGAVADDEGVLFKAASAASAAASMPRSSNHFSSSSDTETDYRSGGGAYSGDMAHLCI